MFLVGNRIFKSYCEAVNFCKDCDFDPKEMITERIQKYNNVIEYILGEFYEVENNYKPENMELFFDYEESELERKAINALNDIYKDCFVFVYQGIKNNRHWYKINLKNIDELNRIFSGWKNHYIWIKPISL